MKAARSLSSLRSASRRDVLASFGAAAILGPLLRRDARGATGASPRRIVLIFTPNGIHGETAPFSCSNQDASAPYGGPAFGSETDFRLGPYYTPLEPLRDRMVVMSRLTWAGPEGWGHNGGSRGPFNAWKTDREGDLPKGKSVDHFVADELFRRGTPTPKRNLHWAIGNVGAGTLNPFWSAPGAVAVPEEDPAAAFAAVFGDAAVGTDPARLRTNEGKRLVIERALGDCTRVAKSLGVAGKEILELHCANLERYRSSIAVATTPDAPCATGLAPASFNHKDPVNYPRTVELMFDLIPRAFACERTRVAAFQFGGGATRLRLPFLSLGTAKQTDGYSADDHHTWTHHGGTAEEKNEALLKINRWYATMVAKLVTNLTTTKDADGRPLIESTAVLWLNEYGTGCATGHDLVNIPGFLFTGASEIKTNRFLRLNHKCAEHKALLTSMIHFMGMKDVRDFGYNGPIKPYDTSGTSTGMLQSEGPLAALYG